MRNAPRALTSLAAAVLLTSAGPPTPPLTEKPTGHVSLLTVLAPWEYPGSTHLGGPSMQDGGNPRRRAVVCRAVKVTRDPVDAVADYYLKTFNTPGPHDAMGHPAVVAGHDDPTGPPSTVRVVVVVSATASTTLAITRGKGDAETRIAWTHVLSIGDGG